MRWRSTSRGIWLWSARRPGLPITSPTKRSFIPGPPSSASSARALDRPRLADHGHLDLAGVGQLLLDLASDVLRQPERRLVADLAAVDDDADLAAGLDGEGLLHPLEARRDLLQLLQPLDVGLQHLAAGPPAGGRQGVRGGHHAHRLPLAIVVARVS